MAYESKVYTVCESDMLDGQMSDDSFLEELETRFEFPWYPEEELLNDESECSDSYSSVTDTDDGHGNVNSSESVITTSNGDAHSIFKRMFIFWYECGCPENIDTQIFDVNDRHCLSNIVRILICVSVLLITSFSVTIWTNPTDTLHTEDGVSDVILDVFTSPSPISEFSGKFSEFAFGKSNNEAFLLSCCDPDFMPQDWPAPQSRKSRDTISVSIEDLDETETQCTTETGPTYHPTWFLLKSLCDNDASHQIKQQTDIDQYNLVLHSETDTNICRDSLRHHMSTRYRATWLLIHTVWIRELLSTELILSIQECNKPPGDLI